MSLIKAQGAGDASTGFYGFTIDQSLRFMDNDAPHFDRTFGSGGNQKTWTWSCWVKIADPSAQKMIFSGASNTSNLMYIQLRGDAQNNRLDVQWRQGSSTTRYLHTNREFRDIHAWYHILWAVDTTQSTDAYKMRLYINGVEETDFTDDSRSTISQNSDLAINDATAHSIGTYSLSPSAYFDGYMAEVHFVDGTQLTPASFGETKAGVWIPKSYTGSHGTTGFYLPFDDSSALGDDESANTNDWTPSGLAATDVVLDSPTNNFGTLNEIHPTHSTLSEANLRTASLSSYTRGNFVVSSGKWYFEILQDNTSTYNYFMGVIENEPASTAYYVGIGNANGGNSPNVFSVLTNTNGTVTQPTGSRVSNVVIGIAVDMDGGNVYFYYNGSLNGKVENITTSEFTEMVCFMSSYTGTIGYQDAAVNFGQDSSFAGHKTAGGNTDGNGNGDFFHSVPSGYLAMCTANLPDPGIDPAEDKEPADNFNTVLYSGNGSSGHAITGVGFQPDWVWLKGTNYNGASHSLTDSVRGATKRLISDDDADEATNAEYLQSFDSDGFTVGSHAAHNSGSHNFVAWNWLAGGTASSNEEGSITSSVSANTEAGFSIVGYTGTGSAGTVGHGLTSAPEMIIQKMRDPSSDENWTVFHKDLTSANYALRLNLNNAEFDGSGNYFSAVSSDTFSIGSTSQVNENTKNSIAYCFHSVDGYSKIGKYISNNSSAGPFVHTGFRPAWLMVKSASTGGSNYDWTIYDNKRSPINPVSLQLEANQSNDDESTRGVPIDFLSNGFKLGNSYSEANGGSSVTYIYLAFAEQPFKYANAR